jgi:hypothetical protein
MLDLRGLIGLAQLALIIVVILVLTGVIASPSCSRPSAA